jgi:hypothetical protein
LGGLSLIAAYHVWASWDYSVFRRGWLATLEILTLVTVPLVLLWVFYRFARAEPTSWRNLLFHVSVLVWFVTLAYPDTLELP